MVRRLLRLLAPALTATALGLAGCGGGGDPAGPGPVPTNIRVQAGNQQTGVVATALTTPLLVVVTDANNRPVANRRVDWDVGPGSGSANPASSTTNSRGEATTVWTLGNFAGTARITAQVTGVNPTTFTATVLPGAAAQMVATPDLLTLGVGDTLRLRAAVRDQFGNDLPNQAISFTSLQPGIASVNGNGLVSAVAQGTTGVIATGGGRADTVPVSVGPAGSSLCGSLMPELLALGQVVHPASSSGAVRLCLQSPDGVNGEYALTLISTAASFGSATVSDVLGLGTTGQLTASLGSDVSAGQASPLPAGGWFDAPQATTAADASAAWQVEAERRAVERRVLTPLAADAREWWAERVATRRLRPSSVAEAKVGDVLRLNVNATSACSNADLRSARVAAVGTNAIIATDTDNPSGGYTDAEYAGILATFDTLVFPIDTTAFGAPSNISQYGKIILLYTRAVNALTPANSGFTIGGFFFARDLYPKTARNGVPACAASNENEMFYLLVPDPNGVVNSNRRTKDEVTLLNLTTIAHELQHLINSSRRLYVNTGAALNEETWLDEGLSHVAEELLYLRVSRFTTRQNLALADVGGTTDRANNFRNYASQNFSRLYNFLIAPEINSPYAPNDSLATRGAIWNFLRFAAGRQGAAGESAFLRALVNSRTVGVSNLQGVLSTGRFADYLRDWTVSLIADDFSTATTAALTTSYINPTWNFRSIFPGLRFSGGAALGVYPIASRTLLGGSPQRIRLAGGTSSYLRFSVPAGQRAVISVGANGAAPPADVRLSLVRLR
ncbi:MAG: Ig-like domain-containing protein [Gemmatimonadaceae bacterium]|nr:Ig-like domain-containing protein [Gemmatimonadaceae bacterium]